MSAAPTRVSAVSSQAPNGRRRRSPHRPRPAAAALAVVAVGCCVAALRASGALELAAVPGFAAPDPSTPWLLMMARLLARLAQVATSGALVLAVLLPTEGSRLSPFAWLSCRWAGRCALAWALAQAMVIPLYTADLLGTSWRSLSVPAVLHTATSLESGRELSAVLGCAAGAALLAKLALRTRTAVLALGVALLAVLPQAAAGHGSAAGNHQIAVSSLVLHIGAVVIWAGGLGALALAARRLPVAALSTAAARFSRVAGVAAAVVIISGVINAVVRLGVRPTAWLDTDYGQLVLIKLMLAAVLLGFGAAHRARSLDELAHGQRRGFARLALGEALVFAAVLGLAVALSRTPPPARGEEYGVSESLLGFPVPPPVTAARLILDWYPEPLFAAAAIAAVVLYLRGVLRLRRHGVSWPAVRTAVWCGGWLIVVIATSSGLARYAPVLTWGHMLQHLLLSMVAAPLLALGAPITLAARALASALRPATSPHQRADASPIEAGTSAATVSTSTRTPPQPDAPLDADARVPDGGRRSKHVPLDQSATSGQHAAPRRALLAALSSRPGRVIGGVWVAWPMFALTPFIVYFTGIYELSLRYHFGHLLLSAHFLIAAFLFFNLVFGLDPMPGRPSYPARLLIIMLTAVAHAVFGIVFMQGSGSGVASGWFNLLSVPWAPSRTADVNAAGGLAWAFGEIPFVLCLLVVANQWYRSDEREQRRRDRDADRPGSREQRSLEQYNDMLARLARNRQP